MHCIPNWILKTFSTTLLHCTTARHWWSKTIIIVIEVWVISKFKGFFIWTFSNIFTMKSIHLSESGQLAFDWKAFFCSILFTARKRSLRRLCFYTCLSFILFTGGVCLSACWDTTPEQTPPPRSRHPLEQTPPGADTPQRRHPLGADTPPPEQTPPPPSRHPPGADTPPAQSMLGDTVNARAVHILLGCNLVQEVFTKKLFS